MQENYVNTSLDISSDKDVAGTFDMLLLQANIMSILRHQVDKMPLYF